MAMESRQGGLLSGYLLVPARAMVAQPSTLVGKSAPSDTEMQERINPRAAGACPLVRAVLVLEDLVLAQGVQQPLLVPVRARSSSSRRQVRTHRARRSTRTRMERTVCGRPAGGAVVRLRGGVRRGHDASAGSCRVGSSMAGKWPPRGSSRQRMTW